MNEPVIGFKLLLNYEVRNENLQEYYQFVMGRYIPMMQAMGLQMSEAWHTAYGEAPNRMVGFVCAEQDTIQELLDSEAWLTLNEELESYVNDFTYKVIPYRGGFQI
jgi:hypothetical protein